MNELYAKVMDLDESSLRLLITNALVFADKDILTSEIFIDMVNDRVEQNEILNEVTRAEVSG